MLAPKIEENIPDVAFEDDDLVTLDDISEQTMNAILIASPMKKTRVQKKFR